MKELLLAKIYAQALYDLAKAQHLDIEKEFTSFQEAISSSNDLENVLFLDVFSLEEKKMVLSDLFSHLKSPSLLVNFISFLLGEDRLKISLLIYKEMMVLDDNEKGLLRGTIWGAENKAPPAIVERYTKFLDKKLNSTVHLDYQSDSRILGGHRVLVDDLLLDATVNSQIEELKQYILGEE